MVRRRSQFRRRRSRRQVQGQRRTRRQVQGQRRTRRTRYSGGGVQDNQPDSSLRGSWSELQ